MMLVQKPQPVPTSPMMSFSHRRQTSAPVVVVQPTHIPGLLSLSKPPRSFPRNQQRQSVKVAPKQALTTSAVGVRVPAQPLTPAAQIYTAPATPPQSRGRAQDSQSRDKNLRNKRSPSQSPMHVSGSGKHNGRQPSPPTPSTMTPSNKKPSQAEVTVNFTNQLDPFIDNSTLTPSPSPRKHPQQSQSKAIPTIPLNYRTPTIARSNPLPILSNRQPRHQQHRPISKRALAIQEFPICDDMSEIADNDDQPSTPVARRLYGGAPLHSAPISSALEFFSSSVPLSSSTQTKQTGEPSRNRKHRRTPSEGGIFHMSSDEEVSSGPGGVVFNRIFKPSVKDIGPFSLPPSMAKDMNTTTPTKVVAGIRGGEGAMSTSLDKAAFFASSVFQNSPSPDELPDPLLL